jgi:sterol desaturase/sphingolipid hydroxylase (fatty acid hydroxylase superfamily)
VERRVLAKRAAEIGPQPSDYERNDTVASLAMGVASLLAPFAAQALVQQVLPGKGRFPKALVRTAAVAAAATTAADAFVRWDKRANGATVARPEASPSRARRRMARKIADRVRRVGGPVAIATGGLALSSTVAHRTSPARMWAANNGRDLGAGLVGWAAAVAGWDFIYYWNHRFMHEVRALWAIHVVHHSSERYNLSTALRQPVADVFGVFLPYGMLARLGVRPSLIAQARGINLIYQFWIHTDAIRTAGPAEEVLNTPSHHRVHHGSNSEYIDRNHGSILILWDRLFGTFQREREPVVYGLTKNIDTFNPGRIASHEHRDIVRDVAGSDTWHDRLSFVLRGPGWAYERHAEVAARGALAS